MMSIRLITRRLFSSASYTDLATQMKSFNESKQYRKTLQLFNENIVKRQVSCSRSTMFHVLKACTQLKDPKLSSNIHQMISNKFNNDPYLLSSLIHLYSNFNKSFSLFNLVLQCNVAMLFVPNRYLTPAEIKLMVYAVR